ncbi:MAG: hypothetical protein AVO38_07195 [delta proteobacterium ML8_D]|nr:MAG: hypothetical protein AVO38_07195 [delta proteobacterium ML8_D]
MNKSSSFHELFRSILNSSESVHDAPQSFKNDLIRIILSREDNVAAPDDIGEYFGPPKMPGTAVIGMRLRRPELFQDTIHSNMETYDVWLDRILDQIVKQVIDKDTTFRTSPLNPRLTETVIPRIKEWLELADNQGTRLQDLIPQQMYEDVFIQMVLMITTGNPKPEIPCFYREFNEMGYRLAFTLMQCLDKSGYSKTNSAAIERLVHIAVLSGYAGINLKSSASAASTLLNRNCIPVDSSWVKDLKCVQAVPPADIKKIASGMMDLSEELQGQYGINAVPVYFEEVVDTAEPTLLAFFSDDYLETIIDLKRFEIMLDRNRCLSVLFIPRKGRYGNDFAHADIYRVIGDKTFKRLVEHYETGRFHISRSGPMAGCIDPRFISENLIRELDLLSSNRRLILETKGCRNFEMLQGHLTAPWYSSFNCNRALSIRTVGIDLHPVFIRIPPGLKAYDGFDNPVIRDTPSGEIKGVRFAGMTTKDLCDALKNINYPSILNKGRNELGIDTL